VSQVETKKLELVPFPHVFLASAWHYPKSGEDPSLAEFLVRGKNEEEAAKLLLTYFSQKPEKWELEEIGSVRILEESE